MYSSRNDKVNVKKEPTREETCTKDWFHPLGRYEGKHSNRYYNINEISSVL